MKKAALGVLLVTGSAIFCAGAALASDGSGKDEMDRQHEMALTFYEAGSYSRAHQLTYETAKKGHPGAQMLLGTMYKDGKGVESNFTEAKVWYEQAAKQGHVIAQFHVGIMYEQGLGGPQDYAQALNWYGQAAESGFSYAQFNLGMMYLQSRGTERSLTLANEWFKRSCTNGIQMGCEASELLSGGVAPSGSSND